ncbi:acyltransferase [Aureimonas sp. Leaf454]|nr:acyltransferase [Aureimonas sp. Leaf454]
MAAALARTALIAATRFLVGGHARWVGAEPSSRQRIYFANHGSHLDTIMLWAALPPPLRSRTHPVAAADYWGKTAGRRFVALDVLGCVLIDRQRATPEADPLAPVEARLATGGSLILFPEGTRGTEALPGPFKAGLHRLAAAHPEVELVPVYLDNLARAFPKGAYLPAPISCSARFGAPIALRPGEDRGAFLERARAAVAALAGPAVS